VKKSHFSLLQSHHHLQMYSSHLQVDSSWLPFPWNLASSLWCWPDVTGNCDFDDIGIHYKYVIHFIHLKPYLLIGELWWDKLFCFKFLRGKNIQLWSELVAPLVNMNKEGCENKSTKTKIHRFCWFPHPCWCFGKSDVYDALGWECVGYVSHTLLIELLLLLFPTLRLW